MPGGLFVFRAEPLQMPLRMIRRPHQRRALHKSKAFGQAHLLILGELIGMHIFGHFQVHFSRLQVLADGQHVAAVGQQVVHGLEDLLVGLAQANHDAGFGALTVVFGALDLLQAAVVFGLGAHLAI